MIKSMNMHKTSKVEGIIDNSHYRLILNYRQGDANKSPQLERTY